MPLNNLCLIFMWPLAKTMLFIYVAATIYVAYYICTRGYVPAFGVIYFVFLFVIDKYVKVIVITLGMCNQEFFWRSYNLTGDGGLRPAPSLSF